MRIFRLCIADMQISRIFKKRYLLVILLYGCCCGIFYAFAYNCQSLYDISDVSLGDLIAFIYCGTIPGVRLIQQKEFQISYMWLVLVLVRLMVPLDYPVLATDNWGYPYVMKCGRRNWWFSKCIYIVLINLICSSLELLTYFIACVLNGWNSDIRCTPKMIAMIFSGTEGVLPETLSRSDCIYVLIITPWLSFVAMGMLLLFFSLCYERTVSYMIGVAWTVLSVFICDPLLQGNGTMVIRSAMIDSEGIRLEIQWASSVGIILLSLMLGAQMMGKKDFFLVAAK